MRSKRKIEGIREWSYAIIVGALAVYFVIGIVAWSWMVLQGIPAPDAFSTTLAAIAGAFAGILNPLQSPSRSRDERHLGDQP